MTWTRRRNGIMNSPTCFMTRRNSAPKSRYSASSRQIDWSVVYVRQVEAEDDDYPPSKRNCAISRSSKYRTYAKCSYLTVNRLMNLHINKINLIIIRPCSITPQQPKDNNFTLVLPTSSLVRVGQAVGKLMARVDSPVKQSFGMRPPSHQGQGVLSAVVSATTGRIPLERLPTNIPANNVGYRGGSTKGVVTGVNLGRTMGYGRK
jgi:hypothetical protein